MISTKLEESFAKKMSANIIIPTSHAGMISQPIKVADFIEKATNHTYNR